MGLGADAVNKVSKSAESRVRGDGFVSSAILSLIDEFNRADKSGIITPNIAHDFLLGAFIILLRLRMGPQQI
jgi:hypothetical protein